MNSEPNPVSKKPSDAPPPAKKGLSPRRRRLRWTAAILSAACLAGIAASIVFYVRSRPAQYRPDEINAEITSNLARGLPPDAPQPRFTDATRDAGLSSFRTFHGERTSQLPEDMGPGAAWGDFDNDGDDDLFLVSAGGRLGLPTEQLAQCELYENLGNGTFRKVGGFPETRIHGMGAAWGDFDADGYLDLIVTGYNTLRLFHNEAGRGRFVRDPLFPDAKGFWSSATWGDYDNDRQLDLYVCGYVEYSENEGDRLRGSQQLGTFVPYTLNPASYPPARNLLFHNNGHGTFTEVAEKLGVTNPTGRSLGALWHDFDDDGWLDLYIANDVSDNAFYRNKGGTFEDVSHAAWVADYRSAMGLAAGDYNRDGDDDLFITHWVAQENALYDNLWADYNPSLAPSTNSMKKSALTNGAPAKPYGLRFMDVNELKGLGQIALPMVGWGTEFVDFDGDGWLDLVVANGNTLEFEGPFPRRLKPQEPFLLWNRKGEYFHNLAPLNKSLSEQHVSRGLAVSDFDNDGDMDILVVQLGEGAQLFRNEMQTGHWLKVRLRSKSKSGAPLGFGDGSKLIAHAGGVGLRRTVSSVSYLSQSSRIQHFGLSNASEVERLEVRWLGGQTNFFTNLTANATYEITEGEAAPKRIELSGGKRLAPESLSGNVGQASSLPVHGASSPRGSGGSMPPELADKKSAPHPQAAPGMRNGKSGTQTATNATPWATAAAATKARLVEFWNKQRAAMNAMKIEKDIPKAVGLFRQALDFDPAHEDSRYYLAQCLALQGDWDGALAELTQLTRLNPQSHRGHQQWGALRALSAQSEAHLAAAEKSLQTAHALNPEETGALLVLGEVALLRGDAMLADQRLDAACRTNPRAVGGFFLRGYLAWKRGERETAENLLRRTREALGKDWQPKGSTSEGDVQRKQHVETSPLSRFWENWDGETRSDRTFASLDAFLKSERK